MSEGTVIRALDGYECGLSAVWLSLSDVFDRVEGYSLVSLRNYIQFVVSKISIFNLAMKKIDGNLYWARFPFDPESMIEEVEPVEEYTNILAKSGKTKISPISFWDESNELQKLVKFTVSFSETQKTLQLKLYMSHIICDGRSFFDTFEIISNIVACAYTKNFGSEREVYHALNEINTYGGDLCEFGQKDNFNLNIDECKPIPDHWEIAKQPIMPSFEHETEFVNQYLTLDYRLVKQYCRKNNVSIQPLLTTIMARAGRKYRNIAKGEKIAVFIPSNTRKSKYATEKCSSNAFFSKSGTIFLTLQELSSINAEIHDAAAKLQTTLNSPDGCTQILKCGESIDEGTLKYKLIEGYSDLTAHGVVVACNIGRITCSRPLLNLYSPCVSPSFSCIYSFYDDNIMYLMLVAPAECDNRYKEAIHESIREVFGSEIGAKVTYYNN